MKWFVLKAAVSSPELWGDSSLLFWHSSNRGRPKFGLLFIGRGELVDIAAPAQTPLAQAEQQVKAHVGPDDAQQSMTWHTHLALPLL